MNGSKRNALRLGRGMTCEQGRWTKAAGDGRGAQRPFFWSRVPEICHNPDDDDDDDDGDDGGRGGPNPKWKVLKLSETAFVTYSKSVPFKQWRTNCGLFLECIGNHKKCKKQMCSTIMPKAHGICMGRMSNYHQQTYLTQDSINIAPEIYPHLTFHLIAKLPVPSHCCLGAIMDHWKATGQRFTKCHCPVT